MKVSEFLKSKSGKILLSLAIVLGIITIFKYGYKFGQWLYIAIN